MRSHARNLISENFHRNVSGAILPRIIRRMNVIAFLMQRDRRRDTAKLSNKKKNHPARQQETISQYAAIWLILLLFVLTNYATNYLKKKIDEMQPKYSNVHGF